jgi:hypothetical protein
MPGVYTINPADPTRPLDTDEVQYYAGETRNLKSYLQTQLAAFGAPASNSEYNKVVRNLIINGDFTYGAAGAVPDMWRSYVGGTATNTITNPAFTLGQIAVPGDPKNYLNCVFTLDSAINSAIIIKQPIESVRTLVSTTPAGANVGRLSFWAKAAIAGTKLGIDNVQVFGTGGTPSAASHAIAGITNISLTTTWTKYTLSIIANDLTGKVIGTNGGDCLELTFWLSAGSNFNAYTNSMGPQAGTVSIARVQLVEGAVDVPFQTRTAEEEQRLLARYIYRHTAAGTVIRYLGYVISTGLAQVFAAHKISMRAAPVVTIAGALNTDVNLLGLGAAITMTAITVNFSDPDMTRLDITINAGGVAGQGCQIYTANANAIITFDARLS